MNGVRSMTFQEALGYEATFALSQKHIDFMDLLGEASWELVSHNVLATDVVIEVVSYPRMKHFSIFKRIWCKEEENLFGMLSELFDSNE